MEHLGGILKESRVEKGLSVLELSGKTRIAVSTIYAIESGIKRNNRFEIIVRLADALELDVRVLAEFYLKGIA